MTQFFVGVDLGQASDFTAITVLETQEPEVIKTRQETESVCLSEYQGLYLHDTWEHRTFRLMDGSTSTADQPLMYAVRHLDRWRNVPYQETIARIHTVTRRVPNPVLAVDRTGVGRPIYDELRAAGLHPRGITIHGGDKMTQDGPEYAVPKRDLIAAAQMALDSGRLKIAAGLAHSQTLVKEVLNFRYKLTQSGHDTYSSWRDGDHDDLLLSLALAVWTADQDTGGKALAAVWIGSRS